MSDRVELEFHTTFFEEKRERLTNKISESRILSKLNNYFVDITKCNLEISSSFSLAIDHFKSVITSVSNKYVIIVYRLNGRLM